jgi:ABC-type transport system involved in multi-copper enzyme maturation permease subunit
MKITALLLIFLCVILLLGFGFMYLLGFAMSFDAPGSTSDPKAWGMRLLMFLPLLLIILALILAIIAFTSGNYKRSAIISSVLIGICGVLIAFLLISSFTSLAKYKVQTTKEAADAIKYPIQKFLRPVEGGTDTIIVFSDRIVAYRKYQGTNFPWSGPLGDLNDSRDTMYYHESSDTKIAINELDQFVDKGGRKFTEVYSAINAKK